MAILMSFIHLSSVHIWGKNRFPSNSSTWIAFQMRTLCKFSTCSKRKAQSKLSSFVWKRMCLPIFSTMPNFASVSQSSSKILCREGRCILVVFRSCIFFRKLPVFNRMLYSCSKKATFGQFFFAGQVFDLCQRVLNDTYPKQSFI